MGQATQEGGLRLNKATVVGHTVAIFATLSGWVGIGPAIHLRKINAHAFDLLIQGDFMHIEPAGSSPGALRVFDGLAINAGIRGCRTPKSSQTPTGSLW